MPATKSVGGNVNELKDAHPDWTPERRLAAALDMARRKGAKIPKAPTS